MDRQGTNCSVCGASRNLDVHHIASRGMGGSSRQEIEDPSNKIVICRSCHTEVTEHRWSLTRDERQLTVVKVDTGETIFRRMFDPQFDASAFFQRILLVDLEIDALVQGIPYLSDEQLVELFAELRGLDKGSWRAQAAVLWEAKQRFVYGDRAWEAMGRCFGIGWRQAYNLARVWETFFKGANGEFCNQLQNCSLQEVTWYIVASETTGPHFWLAFAEDRKAVDPSYSIRDFKNEIEIAGARSEASACGSGKSAKSCRWLSAFCTKLDRIVKPGECPGCDVLPSIEERLR